MTMIYVTGDTHADWMSRLSFKNFPEGRNMTKDDIVIILGDFGIWDGSKGEQKRLDWLKNRPFTTLFIDGNHENYDILDNYPVSEWHGGQVQFIRPSVIHLMRGQVYEIENKTFYAFGGAKSHDIDGGVFEKGDPRIKECRRMHRSYRISHVSWWERELPSGSEIETGMQSLYDIDFHVDYILTHCAPTSTAALLSHGFYKPDRLTDFFEEVRIRTNYDKWLFGHYHQDKYVSVKEIAVYEKILPLC